MYLRHSDREGHIIRLLREYRAQEVSLRRPIWGDAADIIMRRGTDIGREVFCYSHLDRGITQAQALIEREEQQGRAFVNGAVIVADRMDNSKGRFSRAWYAPHGGVWVTLVVSPRLLPEHRPFYSLVLGVACCECVRHYGAEANIKWVNDVHFRGRKLAGMLIEGYISKGLRQEYLLLGIGVNVNNSSFPEQLKTVAISLRDVVGQETPLDEFTSLLLTKIAWYAGLAEHSEQEHLERCYDAAKPINPLIEQWRKYSDTLGRRLTYGFNVYEEPLFEAVALDIDEEGALLLQRDDGVIIREASGEIAYLH